MKLCAALTRNQKESIGLLQIGTFLEYFDLMLYVHMAVLLNELFFPQTDANTTALLSAFAFCSTYVLRPFGALIFGWIGDNIGRKFTVLITTAMMALSCAMMASLPTYEQIGVTAAWVVTLCRMIQGLSSMGEIIGAEVYLTEITNPPERYPVVALISVCSVFGGMCALGVANFVLQGGTNNWRAAFWFGTTIAIFGTTARINLRETPEFLKAKKLKPVATTQPIDAATKKTLIAYLLIFCPWPMYFYFSYIYCGNLLKHQFSFNAHDVIQQNLLVTLIDFITVIFVSLLSYKIFPLKILKFRAALNCVFIMFLPYALSVADSPNIIFIIQVMALTFGLSPNPAFAVFYANFPVLKRLTYATFIYALSRAIMYVVTSFGLIYLTNALGYSGLWLITIPLLVGFVWGCNHFQKLESKKAVPNVHNNNNLKKSQHSHYKFKHQKD